MLALLALLSMAAPAHASTAQCQALVFEMAKAPVPLTLPLIDQGDSFVQRLEASVGELRFVVLVDGDKVTARILRGENDEIVSTGGFSAEGRFELAFNEGGNVMMPGRSLAISCTRR